MILVAVKRVIDYNVRVRVKADGTGVEKNNVKMSINPFDEIAVEAALQLKEQGKTDQVVVVTIGIEADRDVLRHALAMGADRGILITTENTTLSPIVVARMLTAVAEREQPQCVILGKQAIDDDGNQVGQMLAAKLNWAQGTFASKIIFDNDHVEVTREIDGGLKTLSLKLPAVITTDLRLNTPRYISLPNIMKAKSKPIECLDAAVLNVDLTSNVKRLQVTPPPKREAGIKVDSVKTLVEKLAQAGALG